MFWNAFFEGAILKFTHALKCTFLREQLFKFLSHDCCFLVWLLSILTCMHPFCPYFYPCVLVWIFLLKTLWHKRQIMNCNIYHHNNITTKSWILIFVMTILQLKTFKTQVTTNTGALIHLGLYDPVDKRISHTAFNISCLSWKEFESREEQILRVASQL